MNLPATAAAIAALEQLLRGTATIFSGLTEYLLEMERGISLRKEEHFQGFDSMIGGEFEEVFVEDEDFAEDAISNFFGEQRRIYDEQLPRLLRYSFIVL